MKMFLVMAESEYLEMENKFKIFFFDQVLFTAF